MKSYVVFLVATFGLMSTGCQLTPNFETGYEVEPWQAPARTYGSLAVQSFSEERPARVYTKAGKLFLTYVPLIPWVSMDFERLDESVQIQSAAIERGGRGMTLGANQNVAPPFEEYNYPNSFARAVANDLGSSGLFTETAYVGSEDAAGYDYVLTGKVIESPVRRSVTSFGLGMAGVLLWILPVPMAKTTADTEIELTLSHQQSGRTIWSERLESTLSRYFMLYTSSAMVYGRAGAFSLNLEPPPSHGGVDRRSIFGWHFAALRKAMLETRQTIGRALEKQSSAP